MSVKKGRFSQALYLQIPRGAALQRMESGRVQEELSMATLVAAPQPQCELLSLQVVTPVAELIAHGMWTEILWMTRWPHSIVDHFPPPHVREKQRQHMSAQVDWSVAGQQFDEIRRFLWELAPRIIAEERARREEAATETSGRLAGWVRLLDSAARRFQPGGSQIVFARAAKSRYDAKVLIETFFAAWHLKDQSSLKQMMSRTLKICFPGTSGDLLPARIPGRSTIYRSKLLIDLAIMRLRQTEWRADRLYFCSVDSSPQVGRDWLMSRQVEIDRCEVMHVWDAAMALARLSLDEEATHTANGVLMEHVSTHHNPPMALGLGQTTAPHKCAALLHAIFLECPSWQALQSTFSNIVSLTTDMGT